MGEGGRETGFRMRHVSTLGRFDDGNGFVRLTTVAGLLVLVLVWVGLGWNSGVERLLAAFGDTGNGSQMAAMLWASLVILGMAGLALMLLQALNWQRRTAARLRQREVELTEQRNRLRRYVADLERIADVADHDLQEPLRRMVAYSQLLANHETASRDDDLKNYVGQVVDGARRMKALVTGLRAFVAVDSLPSTEEMCSASGAVAVARQRLAEALAEAGATLVVDPLPDVVADFSSLVEVFVQIVGNAVRYRDPGRRPVIRVSSKRDGGMVRFSVCDNGMGIETAQMARMFEIFYRPHAAGAQGPGIGSGLALVRRLVERLGGSVWVESESGVGSTFGFSLRADTIRHGLEEGDKAA